MSDKMRADAKPQAAETLPEAMRPLQDAMAELDALRARLAAAEREAADRAAKQAAAQTLGEDRLASGGDGARDLQEAEKHRSAATRARAEAAGLRRRIAQAQAELPRVAAEAEQATALFELDAWKRLDGRWKKLMAQAGPLLQEAMHLAWARQDEGALAQALSRVKLPRSLSNPGDGPPLDAFSRDPEGNPLAGPSDAAAQLQAMRALVARAVAEAAPAATAAAAE